MSRHPAEPRRRNLALVEPTAEDVPLPADECSMGDTNIAGRWFYYLPNSPADGERCGVNFKGSGIDAERLVICTGDDQGASEFVTALVSLPTDSSRQDPSKAHMSGQEFYWPGGIFYYSFQHCHLGVWEDIKPVTASGGVHYETPGDGPDHPDHNFPSYDFKLEMPDPYYHTDRKSVANVSWPHGEHQPEGPAHVVHTPPPLPAVATYSVIWEAMTVWTPMSQGPAGFSEKDSTIATLAVPGHQPVSWDAENIKGIGKNWTGGPIARIDGISVARDSAAKFTYAISAVNLGHPDRSRIESIRTLQTALQKLSSTLAPTNFVGAYIAGLAALGLSAFTDCDGLIFATQLTPISGTQLYQNTSGPNGWFKVFDYPGLASNCGVDDGHYNAAIRILRTSG